MNQRSRKAIGMVATILFLTVYCLAVMVAGALWLTERHGLLQLGFYVFAGLAWLPGVMAIIRFMARD
jgi:biotin transporter BioY